MRVQDTGGPAFPVQGLNNHFNGMTLRDYFAAKALQGRVAAVGKIPAGAVVDFSALAEQAYALADAMLAARTPAR